MNCSNKETLLLHNCCAPCSYEIVEKLKDKFNLEGFWFNPNIHPSGEFKLRKDSLERLLVENSIKLNCVDNITQDEWAELVVTKKEDRCALCYKLRLNKTAEFAKISKIQRFSTSLLISPYQKHELIKEIGSEVSRIHNIEFYYEDFRPFFYDGKNKAKRDGFYIQKYCGCVFSKENRK